MELFFVDSEYPSSPFYKAENGKRIELVEIKEALRGGKTITIKSASEREIMNADTVLITL